MTLRYPMGKRHTRKRTSAFWGKQKNFNIFSFPAAFDADNVFLAWREGKGPKFRP